VFALWFARPFSSIVDKLDLGTIGHSSPVWRYNLFAGVVGEVNPRVCVAHRIDRGLVKRGSTRASVWRMASRSSQASAGRWPENSTRRGVLCCKYFWFHEPRACETTGYGTSDLLMQRIFRFVCFASTARRNDFICINQKDRVGSGDMNDDRPRRRSAPWRS